MESFALLRPLLFALPPEAAHRLTLRALAAGLGPRAAPDPPELATRVAGLDLSNPVGLAAGFDKDAEAIAGALRAGFGFVEVGTLTPRPQPGNPRPRLFRLPADRAVINRLGFNNGGQAAALPRLARRDRAAGAVGVNIGANRDAADRTADYAAGWAAMAPYADYLTINISSPNTPGLRALQTAEALSALLARALPPPPRPPAFVKIAPDLSEGELEAIADVALATGVDGLIATNTTLARPPGLRSRHRGEAGGLSGAPLLAASTETLRRLRRVTRGRIALIGVGGVASGADAWARIRAGADAVQLYTGLVYGGPGLIAAIKRDLLALMRRDGVARIADAVGQDA
jgi:dihydroorotate dehydrogenase